MNHAVIAIVFALVGAGFFGAALGGGGVLVGIVLGVLAALQIRLGDRVRRLEEAVRAEQVRAAREHIAAPEPRATEAPGVAPIEQTGAPPEPAPAQAARMPLGERIGPAPVDQLGADTGAAMAVPGATRERVDEFPPAEPPAPREPDPVTRAIAWLKTYATTGNVVAKAGVLLLFFGVSFLLKYAIDRGMVSIETRLAAVALGAIGLIVTGWRLRHARAGYALVLQGGGVGLFYLTVFAAAKLYHVVPMGFAFALMFALVALSSLLAVLQDARALATLGAIGGFLAPVLTSTGGGSHVALFSYYALLNAGIVGIAWFKAWRVLNLTGFVFTFVIGAAWGQRFYQPEFFATTEPFLILSFLFYLAVSVMFAHRHPPRLRGYVDGTLVFGLPLVVFALQANLVRDIEFGRAWSALSMGAIYVAVAALLRRQSIEHMRMLTEALLALGVIALSLAIPYAFDGHITAAGWALEGAGLVWIGVRQGRPVARAFGVLLQFAAGFGFFLISSWQAESTMPVLNAACLGSVFIAAGALFTSRYLTVHRERLYAFEQPVPVLLLGWGLIWWYGAGAHEIGLHVIDTYELAALLGFFGASAIALAWLASHYAWAQAAYASWLHAPLTLLLALLQHADNTGGGPVADWRIAGWVATIAAAWFAAARAESTWSRTLLLLNHGISLWLTLFIGAWTLAWSVMRLEDASSTWGLAAWGALAAAALIAIPSHGYRLAWPIGRFDTYYHGTALLPVVAFALLWVVVACGNAGEALPLPFVPLVNPLDLVSIAILIAVLSWWRDAREIERLPGRAVLAQMLLPVTAAIAFLWLNAATARAVHALTEVTWSWHALHNSPTFQTSLSVMWGALATVLMVTASRRSVRTVWIIGAALLGALVLKLFFVDAHDKGNLGRIVAFIVPGVLMLLIGFLSPVPPRKPEGAQA